MKPGFETICVCGAKLVWLRGTKGQLVPIVKAYQDRALDAKDIDMIAHTNEHENSTLYRDLEAAHLLSTLPG